MGFMAPLAAAAFATPAATFATIGTAAAVAGTGYSVYSSIQQANYQSQVAKLNAGIAESNRQAEETKGAADATREKDITGRRIGAALAAQGANGVDTNFGTTAQARDAMQATGDLDAKTMQYNAQVRGLGFANQEAGYLADSSMAQAGGTNKAIGSVLSGASSITGSALKYKQSGVWGS